VPHDDSLVRVPHDDLLVRVPHDDSLVRVKHDDSLVQVPHEAVCENNKMIIIQAQILIFANKQDVKGALSVAEITKQLGLGSVHIYTSLPIQVRS
jgi:signal recognition particle receptor subunit beta